MKYLKFHLSALAFALVLTSYGQLWLQNLDKQNPNFYDVQNAFNDYWEPYNVKSGKYLKNGLEVKAPGWKQFKRWEWYWKQRVGPSGEFPNNTVVWDEWGKQKTTSTATMKTASSNWSPIGPYDETIHGLGRINCIAFHPTNANIFWVGTPAGGLWKTTNGGASWTTITDDLPVLGVSSIAIHPTNPDIIYIATGDGDGALSLSAFGATNAGDTKSIGILKSIDGGTTWNTVLSAQQFEGFLIRKLIIDPLFPDYLFAATNLGVFRTSNAGINWTAPITEYVMDIEFHPTNSDILYVSSYDPNGNAQIFVSTDIGTTWTQTSNFSGINRIDIAVTPANPDAVDLVCSSSSTNGLHSLKYSIDQGQTWSQYFTGGAGANLLGWYDDASDADGQGYYDLAYVINPNDWSNITLGGVNTWRTTDGGTNWNISNIWTSSSTYNTFGSTEIVHADKHFFAYHPLNANILFECNDGGLFKSPDGGLTWSNITNGMQISQLYSISSSQTNSNQITGGRQDNGSFGIDSGTEIELSGGDGMITHMDYSDENYIYTSYVEGKIYRYDFNIPSLEVISDNIAGGLTGTGEWLTPYLIDPTTPTTLYAGYSEVFKTTNRGDSWTQISNFGSAAKLNYLSVAKTNSNYIYAAWLDAIVMTFNGGSTWINITGPLPVGNQFISSIKVDPTDESALLVTFSGYTASEKVYMTLDAGATWSNISLTGLPNLPVNCVEIDKFGGDIYLGTDLGVYYFDTAISDWAQYGTDLPNVVVTDLDIQYTSSKLKAGTFGRGIWDVDLNTPFVVAPVAGFSASLTNICSSSCINFSDNSTNNPTSWNWSFSGATPSSSTQQNPTNICYNNGGSYPVSLTVTNSGGSDTKTTSSYITVNTLPNTATVSGNLSPNQGASETYTATSSGATSYTWSLPSGWSGSSATSSINVTVGGSSGNICATPINSCGNGNQDCKNVTVNTGTGINELDNSEGIVIYPNPSDGSFQIHVENFKELNEIKIVNSLGQVIWNSKVINGSEIRFNDISAGIYSIIFDFENSKIQRTLIVY
jgi:PKD repeat protein